MRNKVPIHKKKATKIRFDKDATVVKLYDTEIVTFTPYVIYFDTGGYQTVTTIRRMNQASQTFNLGCSVYQKKHELYVTKPNGHYEKFRNGIATVKRTGAV